MRDGGEHPPREEPKKKKPVDDRHIHVAMDFVDRTKDSALNLTLRVINHPLTQRHFEKDPQNNHHKKTTRELNGHELPTQKNEQHETQLEDQIDQNKLEDDRVDEANPPSEKN